MKMIKNYYKQFFLRGLVAMGFGPIVLAVIYGILYLCGVITTVSATEMVKGILTITVLAFICGGINVVYQIEELPISKAITLHGIVIYFVYAVVYLTNGWLKKGIVSFCVFTAIFIVGYILTWVVIYIITRRNTDKLNKKINE